MKNNTYLEKNGDYLNFLNKDEFDSKIATLDMTVPSRNDGRKSFHREHYCIIPYLKYRVDNGQIDFPFSIYKADPPDFVLTLNDGKKIGIEHRDITSEKLQKALSDAAKKDFVTRRLSKFKKKDEVGQESDAIYNWGFTGNWPIQEWAELVVEAISDKVDKLNKGHYPKLDSYELLLYSNTHLPNIDLSLAGNYLSKVFDKELVGRWFDRLYSYCTIIYGEEVWRTKLPLKEE